MKTKSLAAVAALLLGVSQASANTVYVVHDGYTAPGGGSLIAEVNGTITTDGNVGILNSADILAWNLNLTLNAAGAGPFNLNGTGGNSVLTLTGNDLTATSTNLFWNYSDPSTSPVPLFEFVGLTADQTISEKAEEGMIGDSAWEVGGIIYVCLGLLMAHLSEEISVLLVWCGLT